MDVLYVPLIVLLIFLFFFTIIITGVTMTILTSAPWVPTPKGISRKMCKLAGLKKGDKVLDLGCGDASILIVAAKEFGATCVGVELNPVVAMMAKIRVRMNGVQDRVKIIRANMFDVDLPDVDVVMMYLLPKATHKIENRIQERYKHLTVVSHGFELEQKEKKSEKIGKATVRKYEW